LPQSDTKDTDNVNTTCTACRRHGYT